MTRNIARLEVWLRAAAAAIVILAFAAGVPWLLVKMVGNPIPDSWDWSQPLTNEAVLGLIAALVWFFWAQMMLCLLIEIVVELRLAAGRSAEWMSQIPGTFGGQQQLARTLVHAVLAIGVGASVAAVPVGTWMGGSDLANAQPLDHVTPRSHQTATSSSPADQFRAPAEPSHGQPPRPDVRPAAGAVTALVDVARGDTLWSIAERHLGSGERWRTIADLNKGRLMPDGHRFVQASSIQPGWQLLIPADGQRTVVDSVPRSSEVTIKPGDTLWGLAEKAYGNGADWPRIYQANSTQVTDPSLILPDQVLSVPDGSTKPARRAQPSEPAHHLKTQTAGRDSLPLAPGPPNAAPVPSGPPAATSLPDQQRRLVEDPPLSAHSAMHTAPPSSDHATERHLAEALAGGGSLLAGGALFVFFAHRRRQFRNRRSGRTIAPTPPELVPAERVLRSTGSSGGVAATFLDRALRDLSTMLAGSGGTLPDVAAVRLSEDRLDLMLAAPCDGSKPPAPWEASEDGVRWSLLRGAAFTHPSDGDTLAPYPALVAIGTDTEGAIWLLDIESAGFVQLAGDTTVREDLARFIAAEFALNVWSDVVEVTVAGFAPELVGLNPSRVRHQAEPDLARLIKAARRVHEASEFAGVDVLEGRLSGRGADSWMPQIVVTTTTTAAASPRWQSNVEELLDEMAAGPARHAAALVMAADDPIATGTVLILGSDRRLTLAPWNVQLTANQLAPQQARTVADLLSSNDDSDDVPMPPASGESPIDELANAAGALRVGLTEPRDGRASPTALLELPDSHYLTTAATTPADLAALAPMVPSETSEKVLPLDPTLDDDLAAWSNPDTTRPRLRLLGPVELFAAGERTAEVNRRCAYFTEIVAYLATREHGATAEQLAEVFRVQTNTIHSRVATVRKWLGKDPASGDDYFPESTLSPSGKRRGIPLYEVVGLLSDGDLFKRLRVRGQAQGPDGIEDLVACLRLASGRPFDQLRVDGYGWLADTPLDQHLTAGVIDVAHVVATHALSTGDSSLALWASEVAIAAAPSEDKPRLDRAAALSAMGRGEEATRYLSSAVCNRSDDEGAPPVPGSRTSQVINGKCKLD